MNKINNESPNKTTGTSVWDDAVGLLFLVAVMLVAVVIVIAFIGNASSDPSLPTPRITQTGDPKSMPTRDITPFPRSTNTPNFPTPTVTLTPSSSPTSTVTPSLNAMPTPDSPLPPCPDSADKNSPSTACIYTVGYDDDGYSEISYNVYKRHDNAVLIMHYNRDENGIYLNNGKLRPGMKLYLPSNSDANQYRDSADLPNLKGWPICISSDGSIYQPHPCIYRAQSGEAYEDIAEKIFSKRSCADLIKQANKGSGSLPRGYDFENGPISSIYPDGIDLLIPDIQIDACSAQSIQPTITPRIRSSPGQNTPTQIVPTFGVTREEASQPTETPYPPP